MDNNPEQTVAAEAAAESAVPRPDPRTGNKISQLFRGFGYLFSGWSFVGKHPGLFKYLFIPLLINILAFIGVGFAVYYYYSDIVAWIWSKPDGWFGRIFWYLFYIFIFLTVLLLGYVAFFIVQAIISAPFNDLLSERVESIVYKRAPKPFSWGVLLAGLGMTILHELAKLSLWLLMMAPLFLLNFVPVIGFVVFPIGGLYISARFFSYDSMDLCMARRMWKFRKKWGALRRHRALTTGFGSAVAGSLLIPILGFFTMPMAAVAGTLLFCDLEQHGAFEDPPRDPAK
jgi:CysZ protein